MKPRCHHPKAARKEGPRARKGHVLPRSTVPVPPRSVVSVASGVSQRSREPSGRSRRYRCGRMTSTDEP